MSDEIEVEEAEAEDSGDKLYSGQDVANIFRVSTKTVLRWSKPGGEFERRNVQVLTTIGGHRRYLVEEIHQLFKLMLEGKLYNDDDKPNWKKDASPSRIAGIPKPTPRDPRLE